jgi:hypothetical protein
VRRHPEQGVVVQHVAVPAHHRLGLGDHDDQCGARAVLGHDPDGRSRFDAIWSSTA